MIEVMHSISSLDLSSGGPSLSVWSLVAGLRISGIDATIITYEPENNNEVIGKDSYIKFIISPRYPRLAYSALMKEKLNNSSSDIYHGHGLWQYPVHAMAKTAQKKNKPYIISPRGMLYTEAMKKSLWFKNIAMFLFQRNDLRNASVIHATCEQEFMHIRDLGFENPIAIIPNSIDVNIPAKIEKSKTLKKRVGFVGRFAPIKNIEILIKAWAQIGKNNPDWELVLIGDGDYHYKTSLIKIADKLNITNILFTGFLIGEEKEAALQSLDYLVLPSKSENFGMVVPEALIREIPVIASKGTPWEELNTRNAGWWINIGVQSLTDILNEALNLPEEKRIQMGKYGRKLVKEKYSTEAVAGQMIQLYKWILEEGEKPEFVYEKD